MMSRVFKGFEFGMHGILAGERESKEIKAALSESGRESQPASPMTSFSEQAEIRLDKIETSNIYDNILRNYPLCHDENCHYAPCCQIQA